MVYAAEQDREEAEQRERIERDNNEERFIMGIEDCGDALDTSDNESNQLNVSTNRSGHIRSIVNTVGVGLQFDSFVRPRIRKTCDCTNEIKSTCAEVSDVCCTNYV